MRNYEMLEKEKGSIVDVNLPIYRYIYDLIYICLNFKSRNIGSHYLSEFVEHVIENDIYVYSLSPTKDIYPLIAEKFRTKPYKIERAIRYSCESSWKELDPYLKYNFFPNGDGKIPTNSEIIYAIYEYIKGHYIFEDDLPKKIVNYKNSEIKQESENYINYKIRFEIQRLLYQHFNFNLGTMNDISTLIDMIMKCIKLNKKITDDDIDIILNELSFIYDFYEGSYINYLNGEIEMNEIDNTILRLCRRIYERTHESINLQKPKDKTYIKDYMNMLSSKVKDNLSFYI